MKDREIACIHYVCEGNCDLGKEGTFRKQCQICRVYRPIPGGRPARPNLKHQKKEKFAKDRRNWEQRLFIASIDFLKNLYYNLYINKRKEIKNG